MLCIQVLFGDVQEHLSVYMQRPCARMPCSWRHFYTTPYVRPTCLRGHQRRGPPALAEVAVYVLAQHLPDGRQRSLDSADDTTCCCQWLALIMAAVSIATKAEMEHISCAGVVSLTHHADVSPLTMPGSNRRTPQADASVQVLMAHAREGYSSSCSTHLEPCPKLGFHGAQLMRRCLSWVAAGCQLLQVCHAGCVVLSSC